MLKTLLGAAPARFPVGERGTAVCRGPITLLKPKLNASEMIKYLILGAINLGVVPSLCVFTAPLTL